ncbi:hypothetical protein [Frondihabitans australicus]|uniref:Uncharacterized protein n=1 Tax=Frondihabitans australicus TaxID=386892 RepID=A0A495IKT8_9MICO|nr:hypothetical protein [Frondihabitans australicus]RKR76350.1 hypothetical protein C8E83_3520 [Frondihabitans australicus]
MSTFTYHGAKDIDRAIGFLVTLDRNQQDALAVLQIDGALDELQTEYQKALADAAYRPSDDFTGRLSGYLEMADDAAGPGA